MKAIINSPVFFFKKIFTGDNVAHYLPAKYLWYHCNIEKKSFTQPVYDCHLNDLVKIDFLFYPHSPQNKYFKKPKWINNFIIAENVEKANFLAKKYDYFVNNYRYRGAFPPELNWGHSKDLQTIDLYVVAYTYKAIKEYGIYLDDLELNEKYDEFLKQVNLEINPESRPIIALHHRGSDPWSRHLPNSIDKNENLLLNLLDLYSDHIFVLLGESWRYFHHPRIKYLNSYINRKKISNKLHEYSESLKYILSAYFCRDVEMLFVGISGFSLFIESIRPLNLMPPIPLFWGPKTFTGRDTFIEIMDSGSWFCSDFEEYKKKHPEDQAFQYYVHHFLYYSRDEELLKPYCMNYPNDLTKILELLEKLECKYNKNKKTTTQSVQKLKTFKKNKVDYEYQNQLSYHLKIYSILVNYKWKLWKLLSDIKETFRYFRAVATRILKKIF